MKRILIENLTRPKINVFETSEVKQFWHCHCSSPLLKLSSLLSLLSSPLASSSLSLSMKLSSYSQLSSLMSAVLLSSSSSSSSKVNDNFQNFPLSSRKDRRIFVPDLEIFHFMLVTVTQRVDRLFWALHKKHNFGADEVAEWYKAINVFVAV